MHRIMMSRQAGANRAACGPTISKEGHTDRSVRRCPDRRRPAGFQSFVPGRDPDPDALKLEGACFLLSNPGRLSHHEGTIRECRIPNAARAQRCASPVMTLHLSRSTATGELRDKCRKLCHLPLWGKTANVWTLGSPGIPGVEVRGV